jgi:glutathione peroxidase
MAQDSSLYDIDVRVIDGSTQSMATYRDKALLIVNVASACGFTPQYAGLEALYRRHKDDGLVVMGFPCDQFGHQEPGTEAEIQQFCATTYDVTFPMFAKVDVNGASAHPLFQFLKAERKGVFGSAAIKWNFTKFLVSRAGDVVGRFGSTDTPDKIEPAVRAALAGRSPTAESTR